MIDNLDQTTAKQIIRDLKGGTCKIENVEYINVGNENWYREASQLFDDIESSKDSLVRFIRGYPGDGKTQFMGMLRSIALNKVWAVSYISSLNVQLNKFDMVYSEIIKNLIAPTGIRLVDWLLFPGIRGGRALLCAVFSSIYFKIYPPGTKEGLKKQLTLEALKVRAAEVANHPLVDDLFGNAVRGFVDAVVNSDQGLIHRIVDWLEGDDTTIPEIGVGRKIDIKISRDAMRSISILADIVGCGGILILLDETERIIDQNKPVRKKSYHVIRNLLDNADDQDGMRSCIIYLAATPDMFTSEKGLSEYEALRSRLHSAEILPSSGYIDWRGVIVDLTKTPLPYNVLVQLAQRIRSIHAIAQNWNPEAVLTDQSVQDIVGTIEKSVFQVSKPRLVTAGVSTILEQVQQNPQTDLSTMLPGILRTLNNELSKEQETEPWTE